MIASPSMDTRKGKEQLDLQRKIWSTQSYEQALRLIGSFLELQEVQYYDRTN